MTVKDEQGVEIFLFSLLFSTPHTNDILFCGFHYCVDDQVEMWNHASNERMYETRMRKQQEGSGVIRNQRSNELGSEKGMNGVWTCLCLGN